MASWKKLVVEIKKFTKGLKINNQPEIFHLN